MSSSDESDSEENILAKKKQLEEKLLLTEKKLARIHERKKCSTNANQRKNSDQNADSSLPSLAKEDEFDSNTFLEEFACMDFDEDEDENSTSFDEENNSRFVNKQKKKAEKLARISSNLQLGSNEAEEYTRISSQCSISGQMYEMKVLALLYLRATIEGWDFRLGTNIQGAGKFDDVGLAYMTENGSKQMLVQLKHKENSTISKGRLLADDNGKHPFSLLRYYESFRTLKEEFDSNTALNRHSQFGDIHFVLCTNATAIPSEGLFTDQDLVTTDSILNTGGKIFRFAENHNFIQEFKDKYSSDVDNDIVKEFFYQFCIYSNQTSERNLDIHIEEEIKTVYGISTYGAKKIRDRLVKEIQAWWGDRTQNHPLKRDEVKFTSDWENLHKFNDGPPKLEFKPEALTSIKDILSSEAKMINCVIDVDKCGPSRDMLTQSIRETSVKCITATLEDVATHQESVLYTWPSRQCPILVITYESGMQMNKNSIDKFSLIFKQALDLEKGSKLFLISKQGELGKLLFGEEFKSSLTEMNITCEMKSITKECHERILQKIINFQGSFVTVESVLGKDCGDAIDAQILSLLTYGDGILQLGHIIEEKQTCYIDRVLTCSSYLNKCILQCNSRDVFAISGVTDEEMDTFLGMPENEINAPASDPIGYLRCAISFQFINMSGWYSDGTVIDSTLTASYCTLRNLFAQTNNSKYPEKQNNIQSSNSIEMNSDMIPKRRFSIIRSSEEFAKLCKKHKNKNVHWLTVENGNLRWKESKGNFNNIKRYISAQKEYFPVNTAWDVPSRIVVVVGDSGMGKSTLLSKIASNSKEKEPERCIIRINLRECVSDLENFGRTISPKEARELLIRHAMSLRQNNESSVGIVFEHILKCTNKVVVFVDGFDEVYPENECKVVHLIRSFMNLRISKMWITSRRNMVSRLERITKTISFELQPLKMFESAELLKQLVHNKKDGTLREKKLTLDVIQKQFLENPLNCEMIAEVQMHTDNKNRIFGERHHKESVINAIDVLEAIVETKFKVSCNKFFQFTSENVQTRELIEAKRKTCIENHQWSALLNIWSYLKIGGTKSVNKEKIVRRLEDFINAVKNSKEVTGIITAVRGGIPQFEHQVYVEYFLALWMKENCCGTYRDVTSMLLQRMIYDPRFLFVIRLFNFMTTKDLVLHTTILKADLFLALPKILKRKRVPEINKKDVAGRTALHLALSLWNTNRETNFLLFLTDNQRDAIGKLLQLGAIPDIQDDILKWSPFRYSNIKTVPWCIVAIMMENNGIPDTDMRELIERVQTQKRDALEGLAYGVRFDSKTLVSFLINNGVCVNDIIEEMEDTVLIIAASYGKYDMLQYLHSKYFAKPEIKNRNGDSPLHWACLHGYLLIAKYLINVCNITVDIKNNSGYTPLLAAARGGHLEIVQYLRETCGSDPQGMKNMFGQSALSLASGCVGDDIDLVKYLVEKCGLNPNEYNIGGWLPIHVACEAGNANIIRYFVKECNIDPMVETKNRVCMLQIFIAMHHTKQVKKFVNRYKLSLDIKDCAGNTLLMWALINPQPDKCEYLLQKCTNITDLNIQGNSALHIYILNCRNVVTIDCIKWLVEKCQIDPNIENCHGQTALKCAILRYQNPVTKIFTQPEVVEYLKTKTRSHSKTA